MQFVEDYLKEFKDPKFTALMAEIYAESYRNSEVMALIKNLENESYKAIKTLFQDAKRKERLFFQLGWNRVFMLFKGFSTAWGQEYLFASR